MIKANELRIGNWIKHGNDAVKVAMIMSESLYVWKRNKKVDEGSYKHLTENDTEPIPLTPEILEKAGFDNTKGTSTSNYKNWCSNGFIDVRFKEDGCFTVFYISGGVRTIIDHIRYLHQIQNFFFSFADQELPITL